MAVAVAVPLTLSGALAHAEPPARPSPAASETDEGRGSEHGKGEGSADLERSAPEPAPATELEPAPATEPAPAPAPTAVATDDVLALTGDALWKGIIGHRVRLEVRTAEGRVVLEGELVAQSADQLALAVSGTGKVGSVPKGDVLGIVVDPPPSGDGEPPGKTGHGLLIGGGFMLGVGLPLLVVGAAFGGYYQSPAAALGYGLPGGLLIAGGIPMVVFGAKRHREHRKNFGFAGVTPNVRVGRDGAVGGVTLRF